MKKSGNKTNINKKSIIIIAAVAVVVIAIIVGIILATGNKKLADVEGTIGTSIWLEAGQTFGIVDGENTIVLKVDSKYDFDKQAESYSYEVPYVLTVNEVDYSGMHTFSKGYSIHSEDNDMPYQVGMLDFETGKLQVVIRNK